MPPTNAGVVLRAGTRTATVDFWNNNKAGRTLIIHTHGMQDEPTHSLSRAIIGADLAGGFRNFAFVVPWDRAMNNITFISHPTMAVSYVNAFRRNASKFKSLTTTSLKIYPYLFPIEGVENVLDVVYAAGVCDVLCLVDLNTDYMTLTDLLSARHPVAGDRIRDEYDNFLLLACRSNTRRGIGFGGAPHAFPDGLYKMDRSPPVLRYPFGVQESPF
jgi:hypothetical protein